MSLRNNLDSVVQKLSAGGYNITDVFDVGANQGRWTAKYSKQLPGARFCMFEANPKQRSPKLAPNHKWFNSVLSKPGASEVEFYAVSGTGDSYYKEQTKAYDGCSPLKLPTTTLDVLVKENSLPHPQLMKMDTQGSELDILHGANSIINTVDIIVIEMAVLPYNKGAPTFDDYLKFLIDLDFVPVGVEEIHVSNNMLVQLDIVFLRKHTKETYYGNNEFFTTIKR